MARDLSSVRIEWLNMLLGTLRSRKHVSRNELLTSCGYVSGRTLEGDIKFLREAFGKEA